MALIDIHIPDERIIAYLEREHDLQAGQGTIHDIVATNGRVTLSLTYDVGRDALKQLALGLTPLNP